MPKKKLSIAHMHWGFPPIIGGVETHLTILMPELTKMGHKVSLLTGAAENVKLRYNYKGVDIFRHPVMDLNWLAERGINGLTDELTNVFKGFVEQARPDIIHTHNMHYFSKMHVNILQKIAKKRGIPLVLTAHNVWDDNLFLDLVKRPKWAHIIAVSHFIKREIIGAGYRHKDITVIHHGIDETAYSLNVNPKVVYKKYPILKGKKIVFHPARMGLAKGCDVTIKAFRLIRNRFPNTVLVLAGTKNIIDWAHTQQKDIAYMVNLIKSLKLKDSVLVDVFALEDMPALYAASSVCVYPSSVSEPFGLTMLEALSSGKPMVVTEAGGMPEIIKDGINGFVIPVKDFESLASRVTQLLSEKDVRERLGITGRHMVEQHYTKEIIAKNTLSIYRKFC